MARFLFFFSHVLPHPVDHKLKTTSLQSLSLHPIFSPPLRQAPLLLSVGRSLIFSMLKEPPSRCNNAMCRFHNNVSLNRFCTSTCPGTVPHIAHHDLPFQSTSSCATVHPHATSVHAFRLTDSSTVMSSYNCPRCWVILHDHQ